jgi:hypothetical protein
MASSSPANVLIARLDAFYDALLTFQSNPSDENLQRLGAFFSSNCIAESRSMRHWKHRAIGRENTMKAYREILGEQVLKERRVVPQVAVAVTDPADPAGPRIYCEMANRYDVQGLELDPMVETVVVRVNNDRRLDDHIHATPALKQALCCLRHIVDDRERKRAVGMYAPDSVKCGLEFDWWVVG